MEITDLLQMACDSGASDIVLVVGSSPVFRIDGVLEITDLPVLKPKDAEKLIFAMIDEEQLKRYKREHELDTSYTVPGMSRFRINIHQQRGSVAAALRRIPLDIPTLEKLRLPTDILKDLCRLRSGLILITGQCGSGKSTTLAAMLDIINKERACHVITIEDPIEFLHRHKKAIVEQREVHSDTPSFSEALRNVLRQDPDVVLIGEMRDLETISTAITASETGQLVFATLHTIDASETINRIIDVFPWRQQQQVKLQLASTVKGVISQRLIPRSQGKGRIVACEVMLGIAAVKNLIREGNMHQLQNVIETGAKYGMQSMDQALIKLHREKLIDQEELILNIKDKTREEIRNISRSELLEE